MHKKHRNRYFVFISRLHHFSTDHIENVREYRNMIYSVRRLVKIRHQKQPPKSALFMIEKPFAQTEKTKRVCLHIIVKPSRGIYLYLHYVQNRKRTETATNYNDEPPKQNRTASFVRVSMPSGLVFLFFYLNF